MSWWIRWWEFEERKKGIREKVRGSQWGPQELDQQSRLAGRWAHPRYRVKTRAQAGPLAVSVTDAQYVLWSHRRYNKWPSPVVVTIPALPFSRLGALKLLSPWRVDEQRCFGAVSAGQPTSPEPHPPGGAPHLQTSGSSRLLAPQ